MSEKKIFREKALDSVFNPEQLDQNVRVTKPFAWVLLTAIVIFVIGVGIWAFTGNLSKGIDITGVIFSSDGVIVTNATSTGKVTDVLVEENSYVEKGDVTVVIPDEELLAQIKAVKAEYDVATGAMKEAIGTTLDALKHQYIANSFITANKSGTVTSVPNINEVIAEGQEVTINYSEERMSGDKDIVCYVPYSIVQSLKIGQEVQISPSAYPREQYGYIIGEIKGIASTTVTEESVIRRMGTTKYIGALGITGDSVEVKIRMNTDTSSKSGFEWSNSKGADEATVNIGEICSIKVITENKAPITMFLK